MLFSSRRRRAQESLRSLPDYLIAAAAQLAGLTLLHCDSDFELLATTTGQAHEWVAPRGSA